MRKKLESFTEFSKSLYPHEIEYLMSIQNFSKPVNLDILMRIKKASDTPLSAPVFDPAVDKRVYSYMKKWIVESLSRIDVDLFFEWLIGAERKVMTDIISPTDEKEIIGYMKKTGPTHYYFVKFYELLQSYRDYMMVRNRKRNNILVGEYLDRYRGNYNKSLEVKTRINQLTEYIVDRDTEISDPQPETAEALLKDIYMDDGLDGHNRYLAVVRLTIHYYNIRRFDKQAEVYAHLDELQKTPLFYSKRILANYYANCAMLHSKLNDLPRAEKYAHLSICVENRDYLLYLVNLSVVLIRQGKNAEAYKLMHSSIPKLKHTSNKYYKIGFVSFYIRTLLANGKNEKAVEYASGYLEAYRKDIFEHRWHLFFSAYLEALIATERYSQALSLCRRNKLVAREKQRIHKADYLPIILYHSLVAEYMENVITRERFIASLTKPAKDLIHDKYRSRKVREMLDALRQQHPEEIKAVREELNFEAKKKKPINPSI